MGMEKDPMKANSVLPVPTPPLLSKSKSGACKTIRGSFSSFEGKSFLIEVDGKTPAKIGYEFAIDYCKNQRHDLGLMVIWRTHPSITWKDGFLKIMPVLVLMAQWIMFAAITQIASSGYSKQVCPNAASVQAKALMFGVSLLYSARSILQLNAYVNYELNESDPIEYLRQKDLAINHSTLDFYMRLDKLNENLLQVCVYVVNLLIVYATEDATDMVLNSLALEFLMHLDNEFVEQYYSVKPNQAEVVIKAYLTESDSWDACIYGKAGTKPRETWKHDVQYAFDWFWAFTETLCSYGYFLLPPFCFLFSIFGFMCK